MFKNCKIEEKFIKFLNCEKLLKNNIYKMFLLKIEEIFLILKFVI